MPYLGNNPTANFATVTKDTFSGNASTTAFTLSKPATTNGVAVYVENVRQIPTTAYSVSGTTLTFTGTPPSGTNNIYVMHHNTPVSTATHPSTRALEATSGTFSTTLGVTGTTKLGEIASIGQATPLSPNDATSFLHIGDNNNQDTSIILEDAVEIWEIYKNDTLSFRKDTTIVQELHRDGYVTQPLQPAFCATMSANQNNIAANGASHVIEFNTERFDQNADYDTGTYTFTAPVTGRYQLNLYIRSDQFDQDTDHYRLRIDTSNRTYEVHIIDPSAYDEDVNYIGQSGSVLADMDAGDTAIAKFFNHGTGNSQVDLSEGHFSGYLVC